MSRYHREKVQKKKNKGPKFSDGQTDRQKDRQIDRQTERQMNESDLMRRCLTDGDHPKYLWRNICLVK